MSNLDRCAGLFCLLPAPAVGLPQDEATVWSQELTNRYSDLKTIFTPKQIEELGELAVQKTASIQDPQQRQDMRRDIRTFVAENYMSCAFVHIDPARDDQPGTERAGVGPSSWELFRLDLEKRIDHGVAQPKRAEDLPLVNQQIDRLSQEASTRLLNTFWGPGAEEFVRASIDRFDKSLRYLAKSNLEFGFAAPLTPEQFKELEHSLRTFVPEDSGTDKSVFREPGADPSRVFIENAKTPPMLAINIADFQMFLDVHTQIVDLGTPQGFYDARYLELSGKMRKEIERFSASIDQKAKKRREETRLERLGKPKAGAKAPPPSGDRSPPLPPESARDQSTRFSTLEGPRESPTLRILLGVIILAIVFTILALWYRNR